MIDFEQLFSESRFDVIGIDDDDDGFLSVSLAGPGVALSIAGPNLVLDAMTSPPTRLVTSGSGRLHLRQDGAAVDGQGFAASRWLRMRVRWPNASFDSALADARTILEIVDLNLTVESSLRIEVPDFRWAFQNWRYPDFELYRDPSDDVLGILENGGHIADVSIGSAVGAQSGADLLEGLESQRSSLFTVQLASGPAAGPVFMCDLARTSSTTAAVSIYRVMIEEMRIIDHSPVSILPLSATDDLLSWPWGLWPAG